MLSVQNYISFLEFLLQCNISPRSISNYASDIKSDNRAVVDVLNSNRTRDHTLGAILCEVLMLQAVWSIELKVVHVMGECNPVADALSRVHMSKCFDCINELKCQGFTEVEVSLADFMLTL